MLQRVGQSHSHLINSFKKATFTTAFYICRLIIPSLQVFIHFSSRTGRNNVSNRDVKDG